MSTDSPTLIQAYRRQLAGIAVGVSLYALLGFFLAPWLIEKNATETVRETYGAELSFDRVAVNPFVMSLELNGIALDEPSGEAFLTVERLFVNFQLSSLFRWALTFREVSIDSPELSLARDGDGAFNFDFLVPDAPEDAEPEPESGPLRLLIREFAVRENIINWEDELPPEPVSTRFGPTNIAIAELNTLPERPGQQDVVITTDTQGTLSWNGSLQFNPLLSEGHASVKGSHFPLTSAYLKHQAGFEITEGEADVEFDYRVAALDDGTLRPISATSTSPSWTSWQERSMRRSAAPGKTARCCNWPGSHSRAASCAGRHRKPRRSRSR